MSEPFIGQITIFAGNFAPRGWAFCAGQTMAITTNTALFSILGTTYGGNGTTTFQLPDLRGRVAISPGQGPGLSGYVLGELAGAEGVTLTTNEMPNHTHYSIGSEAEETTNRPDGVAPAIGGIYATPTNTPMALTSPNGGSQPHENRQPFLALNYIIALEGIYPSRN